MATFLEVADALRYMLDEQGTPKNVRERVNRMLAIIKEEGEPRMKADKLLSELDDLQSDINIPTYVRTQIWGVAGMLERIEE